MSDVDVALIQVTGAIVVTLIASFAAYMWGQRAGRRALRQEVALRPYVDRVSALKTVYVAMMECAYLLNRSANSQAPRDPTEYRERFGEPIDEFTRTLYKNGIWLSKVEPKLLDVLGVFRQTGLAMMPTTSTGAVSVPWTDLIQKPAIAGKAIADELGIDILEQELNSLMSGLRVPAAGTASTQPSTQPQSPNPNRDVELLKINLAADYRLGWLVAMTGVYFALIVGLLVAWYQKFSSDLNAFYYLGLFLIVGVFGALLITQELIPYKNWFLQMDEWFTMIESNRRIPDVSKLVRQRDRRESFRRLIFIMIVLLDVYFTLLGYPALWLFVGFTALLFVAGYVIQKLPFDES